MIRLLMLLSLCAACQYKTRTAPPYDGAIPITVGEWGAQGCAPTLFPTTDGVESFGNNILIPRDPFVPDIELTVLGNPCELTWFLPNPSDCDSLEVEPCCGQPAPNVLNCTFGTPLHPVVSLEVAVQAGQSTLPITLTFLPTTAARSIFAHTDVQATTTGTAADPTELWGAVTTANGAVSDAESMGVYVQGATRMGRSGVLELQGGVFLAGGFDDRWAYSSCGCGGRDEARWEDGPVMEWDPGKCAGARLEITPTTTLTAEPLVRFSLGSTSAPSGLQGVSLSAAPTWPDDIDGDPRGQADYRGADTLPTGGCPVYPQPPPLP